MAATEHPTRAHELADYAGVASACSRCRLAETRTQVVFGAGNPDAELMFVGEAPGFHEDQQGVPFVGQAGKLLDRLLGGIGMTRAEVYIANTLKCLRYDALVQLGDGSWERIGRLVRTGYAGTVMSVDADGRVVPRRVTGWHATPLGDRRVLRLSYAGATRAGASRVGIQLTADHPVLTRRGYVAAGELRPDDDVATGQGLSALARDVACGTLLGEASIVAGRSHLLFAHSDREAAYAELKASLLAELAPSCERRAVSAVAGGEAYPVVHVRTRASGAVRALHSDFHGDAKRVPRWLEHQLNPRMLAFWFMDDGHMRRAGTERPRAEIATRGFAEADLQILLGALQRLGLPATVLRGRIFFGGDSTVRLSELIAPYVPESMRYKLDPEVEARIPFDPTLLRPGLPEVVYDRVVVEDVTDHPRTDTTFFCIDVEETHNFVTAGGVVHNCRPPGNRDPMPDEIEACESHLFRQLGLIRPTLVATLGNFATKLLSGKQTGITRVHGQEQEAMVGGHRVVLYPLYHPAAALYTPAMLKVLEEDFARIPSLLGRTRAPEPVEPEPEVEPEPLAAAACVQLGLF